MVKVIEKPDGEFKEPQVDKKQNPTWRSAKAREICADCGSSEVKPYYQKDVDHAGLIVCADCGQFIRNQGETK